MHWFWRGVIAVVVSFMISVAISLGVARVLPVTVFTRMSVQIPLHIVQIVIPILVFGLLSLWLVPFDRETRCRKCGYILRGIPEPRCSECGERI